MDSGSRTIIFHPQFDTLPELAHHYHSARYYLPGSDRIIFQVASSLRKGIRRGIGLPDYMGNIDSPAGSARIRFHWTDSGKPLAAMVGAFRPHSVYLWAPAPVEDCRIDPTVRIVNVDRLNETWSCYNYPAEMDRLVSPSDREKRRAQAQEHFLAFLQKLPACSKVYVFGTGPSVLNAGGYDFSDGYRIVCNTIIKDRVLMRHIRPHFVVAADAIYHFGVSRYACRFRADLAAFLAANRSRFLIPELYHPNFVRRNPALSDKTIPVAYDNTAVNNFNMKESFAVCMAHNVLCEQLLPLASSLADEIYFLGFDGRKPTDLHFWRSDARINYEDLKAYHRQAHPGFFSGMDYARYAEELSDNAEKIMRAGERLGKRYASLNPSSTHAFATRYYGGPDRQTRRRSA